jgi:hypothetical protein
MDLDRRWILLGIAVAVAVFFGGFAVGAVTGGDNGVATPATTTTAQSTTGSIGSSSTIGDPTDTTLPEADQVHETIDPYGTVDDRDFFLGVMRDSGIASGGSDALLAAADEICYHLERLLAQDRSAAYAVRVVWNEALGPLESEDLALFGTMFVAAPHFLCPESQAYAEEVSYWLGY